MIVGRARMCVCARAGVNRHVPANESMLFTRLGDFDLSRAADKHFERTAWSCATANRTDALLFAMFGTAAE